MNRIILILLIVFTCAWPLLAQGKAETKPAKCTLGLDLAPELRGLRVGLSQASVLARFPGTSLEKPDKFGMAQMRFTVIDTSAIPGTAGGRDKGIQPDVATGGEGSAFIVDSAKVTILKGVRRVYFRFVDGRLAYVQMAYDDSIQWNDIDELVKTVAEVLKLPSDWSVPADANGSSNQKALRCDGFVITGHVGGDAVDSRIAAQLSVEDLAASKILEKRQADSKDKAKQAEEAKRKAFKP